MYEGIDVKATVSPFEGGYTSMPLASAVGDDERCAAYLLYILNDARLRESLCRIGSTEKPVRADRSDSGVDPRALSESSEGGVENTLLMQGDARRKHKRLPSLPLES